MNFQKLAGSFMIAVVLLVSCSKKTTTGVEDITYSGPKMVSFNNYEGYQSASIPVKDSFITIQYQVKLANTTSTANGPIRVKLVKDDNIIYEYNTANGASLFPVPLGSYRFEQTEITIPAGARTATVRFQVNPAKFGTGGSPAFGLSIFSVDGDGAVVHTDNAQTHLVVEILALNQWDGIYRLKGYILRAGDLVKTGIVAPYDMPLITTGANSVEFYDLQLWADGTGVAINYPVLSINSTTNAVTVTSNPLITPPVTNNPNYTSRYNPADKTFYISFYWNGDPNSRLCTDTLTYLRPR
jgi:hypothetical protein